MIKSVNHNLKLKISFFPILFNWEHQKKFSREILMSHLINSQKICGDSKAHFSNYSPQSSSLSTQNAACPPRSMTSGDISGSTGHFIDRAGVWNMKHLSHCVVWVIKTGAQSKFNKLLFPIIQHRETNTDLISRFDVSAGISLYHRVMEICN